jgi:hypothetical protein
MHDRRRPGPAARSLSTLVAGVAGLAAAVFAVFAVSTGAVIADHPAGFFGFLAATIVLQLKVVQVPEEGAVSFASIGMLGTAFAFGTGPAMAVAAVSALARFAHVRGPLDRTIFDAGTLALASAAAAGTFHAVGVLDAQPHDRFGPSIFAAAAFFVVNVGLVSVAMGLAEGRSPFQVWQRRFRWMTPWALAAGPFAAVAVVVWDRAGAVGIVALAIAPLALVLPASRRTYWMK